MTTGTDINNAIKKFLSNAEAKSPETALGSEVVVNGAKTLVEVPQNQVDDVHLAILLLLGKYRAMQGAGTVACSGRLYYLNPNGGKDVFIKFPIEIVNDGMNVSAMAQPQSDVTAEASIPATPKSSERSAAEYVSFSPTAAQDESAASKSSSVQCCTLLQHAIALQEANVVTALQFVQLAKSIARTCQN